MDDRAAHHALRTEQAAADLTACSSWAAEHRLHLLLEHRVATRFSFVDAHLPGGTVDARDMDALALAIADPTALLVTAGGHYWGTPLTQQGDWATFTTLPRTWAVLGVSALTGIYYGLHVKGIHAARFVGGVREEPRGIDATIRLVDGSVATAVRTTVGMRLEHGDTTRFCDDLDEALALIELPVIRIDAPRYDSSTLAALVEQAGVLPDESVVLNGETWHRAPALRLSAPRSEG